MTENTRTSHDISRVKAARHVKHEHTDDTQHKPDPYTHTHIHTHVFASRGANYQTAFSIMETLVAATWANASKTPSE